MTFNPTQPRENDGRFGSVHRGDPGQFVDVADETTMVVHRDGTCEWRDDDGRLHRLDGPSVEDINDSRQWRVNGELYRLDGPAVEDADGSRSWRVNNRLHRLDGSAVEDDYGYREWWVNDEFAAGAGPGEPDPPHVT